MVEQFISWLDLFLQHYQTGLTVSSKLCASLKALQLEVGCRGNPLEGKYSWFRHLSTDTWLSAVWECIWTYDFKLHLNCPTLPLPRESDIKIIEIFVGQGRLVVILAGAVCYI
jgi:hypothetical protein